MKFLIKIFYLPLKLWCFCWSQIWDLSENTGISLGRLGPWVFAQILSEYRCSWNLQKALEDKDG